MASLGRAKWASGKASYGCYFYSKQVNRVIVFVFVVDFHQRVSLQRHSGFHLPAVHPAAQLPTEQLEPNPTKDYVSVLRHPKALHGTILYDSFLLRKHAILPE